MESTDHESPDFEQWQEETRTVPQLEFEPEFDQLGNLKGLTHRIVDREVTERFRYARLLPHQICEPDAHYSIFKDGGKRVGGRVQVQCRHCNLGKNFVVGVHRLVEGKIIEAV